MEVEEGSLDYLRLTLPETFSDVQVEPALPFEVLAGPAAESPTLLIHFPDGVVESTRLKVFANIKAAPNAPLTTGAAGLLDFPAAPRYLVLPALDWELVGLRRGNLPDSFEPYFNQTGARALTAVGNPVSATVRGMEQSGTLPRTQLADYFYAWTQSGSHGVARFDVEPGSLRYCELVLPEGFRMVQTTVSGAPAEIEQLGPQRWKIRMAP